MTRSPLGEGRTGAGLATWVRVGAFPVMVLTAVGPPGHVRLVPPHPTVSVPVPAGPQLSISITDGRHTARPGQQLSYLIRVLDAGRAGSADLTISQTLPGGTRFLSASDGGRVSGGQIIWHITLGGHSADTVRSAVRLIRPPAGVLRLAAVACAATQRSRPLVCAAHLDQLPAGAALSRPATVRGSGTMAGGAAGALAAAAAAVLLALGGWRLWVRRRPRHAG
jgi:uncharacterized repeat protein (TIGR01451 family)